MKFVFLFTFYYCTVPVYLLKNKKWGRRTAAIFSLAEGKRLPPFKFEKENATVCCEKNLALPDDWLKTLPP